MLSFQQPFSLVGIFLLRPNKNLPRGYLSCHTKFGPDLFSHGYKKKIDNKDRLYRLPAFLIMIGLIWNSLCRFRMLQDYLILKRKKTFTDFEVIFFLQ